MYIVLFTGLKISFPEKLFVLIKPQPALQQSGSNASKNTAGLKLNFCNAKSGIFHTQGSSMKGPVIAAPDISSHWNIGDTPITPWSPFNHILRPSAMGEPLNRPCELICLNDNTKNNIKKVVFFINKFPFNKFNNQAIFVYLLLQRLLMMVFIKRKLFLKCSKWIELKI